MKRANSRRISVMVIIFIVVIVLYILYKYGADEESREEKNVEEKNVEEVPSIEIQENFLSNEDILEIYSKIIKVSCIDTNKFYGDWFLRKTSVLADPFEIEKLVGTVIMIEDAFKDFYVQNNKICIELNSYYGKFICEIEEFKDTLVGNLNISPITTPRVTVVGVLDRLYSIDKRPNRLKKAVVIAVYDHLGFRYVPEVMAYLTEIKRYYEALE